MKLETRKYRGFDLWVIQINKEITLRIFFYTLRSTIAHFVIKELFSCWQETYRGNQITVVELPFIYIEIITPRFLFWVNDQKLIDFALNILKDRLNEINDNTAYYLLGKSDTGIDHDELAESQVLNQVLNFYGVNKNEN